MQARVGGEISSLQAAEAEMPSDRDAAETYERNTPKGGTADLISYLLIPSVMVEKW